MAEGHASSISSTLFGSVLFLRCDSLDIPLNVVDFGLLAGCEALRHLLLEVLVSLKDPSSLSAEAIDPIHMNRRRTYSDSPSVLLGLESS